MRCLPWPRHAIRTGAPPAGSLNRTPQPNDVSGGTVAAPDVARQPSENSSASKT